MAGSGEKELIFEADSLDVLSRFPVEVKRTIGFALRRLQEGEDPHIAKPLKTVGPGAFELRAWGEAGTYRAVYVLLIKGKIHVLHCFKKTSQKTERADLEKAAARYRAVKARVR